LQRKKIPEGRRSGEAEEDAAAAMDSGERRG
jgi:hypothetical protein